MGSHGMGDASLQQHTLAAYLAMCASRENWTRRLAMLSASAEASPFGLAVLAAGGTVLWVCADQPSLRESSLSGLTDFQVTTLGEALRILKNEIRKGLPVSVGVLDASGELWDEAVQRGVQPDAVLAEACHGDAATLVARGAKRLGPDGSVAVAVHVAETWRDRRAGDASLIAAAGAIPEPNRTLALRWLRSAPRLFPRDLTRVYTPDWQLHPMVADAGHSAG